MPEQRATKESCIYMHQYLPACSVNNGHSDECFFPSPQPPTPIFFTRTARLHVCFRHCLVVERVILPVSLRIGYRANLDQKVRDPVIQLVLNLALVFNGFKHSYPSRRVYGVPHSPSLSKLLSSDQCCRNNCASACVRACLFSVDIAAPHGQRAFPSVS